LARPLGNTVAGAIAAPTVFFMPGFFGFIVWEFKENWKLYRANRKKDLDAVHIGHHGETMASFMKPGFHSGTIPKAYAKLRRATRKGDTGAVLKHKAAIFHIEESIRRFVERDLSFVLDASARWRAGKIEARAIEIASNRVRVELACEPFDASARIAFDEQS